MDVWGLKERRLIKWLAPSAEASEAQQQGDGGERDYVASLEFDGDGACIAAGYSSGVVDIYRVETAACVSSLRRRPLSGAQVRERGAVSITELHYSPFHATLLGAADAVGVVVLWDVSVAKQIAAFRQGGCARRA